MKKLNLFILVATLVLAIAVAPVAVLAAEENTTVIYQIIRLEDDRPIDGSRGDYLVAIYSDVDVRMVTGLVEIVEHARHFEVLLPEGTIKENDVIVQFQSPEVGVVGRNLSDFDAKITIDSPHTEVQFQTSQGANTTYVAAAEGHRLANEPLYFPVDAVKYIVIYDREAYYFITLDEESPFGEYTSNDGQHTIEVLPVENFIAEITESTTSKLQQ